MMQFFLIISLHTDSDQDLLWEFYQDFLSGFTIALISHSLDPSLSTRLRDLLSRSLSGRLIADEKQAI